jgi:hypothetical protein
MFLKKSKAILKMVWKPLFWIAYDIEIFFRLLNEYIIINLWINESIKMLFVFYYISSDKIFKCPIWYAYIFLIFFFFEI